MSQVLVDTNVISYVFKGDTRAEPYRILLEPHDWFVCFVTKAELSCWASERNWGHRRKFELDHFLAERCRVVPHSDALTERYVEVRHQTKRAGLKIDYGDSWIAAAALLLDIPLVTHNRKHFEHLANLEVLSVDSSCMEEDTWG